jgi:hypothetical protein
MTRALIAALALAVSPAPLLRAAIIYSDFGSADNPFNQDSGEVVTRSADLQPSFLFSPVTNMTLTQVDFVASIGDPNDVNQISIVLSGDTDGHPGTVLASHEFDNAMGILGGEALDVPVPPVVLSWAPSDTVNLLAGQSYWITLDGPVPGDVTWNDNTTLQSFGVPSAGYSVFEGGQWLALPNATLGALQITGEEVDVAPEPGTALLLGMGLLGTVGFRRRVRK